MIGWKKVICDDGNQVILKMLICNKNLKVPLNENENIARDALIMRIYDMQGFPTDLPNARSIFERSFSYKVGKVAIPKNKKRGGIWFWKNFSQAVAYQETCKFEWFKPKEINF